MFEDQQTSKHVKLTREEFQNQKKTLYQHRHQQSEEGAKEYKSFYKDLKKSKNQKDSNPSYKEMENPEIEKYQKCLKLSPKVSSKKINIPSISTAGLEAQVKKENFQIQNQDQIQHDDLNDNGKLKKRKYVRTKPSPNVAATGNKEIIELQQKMGHKAFRLLQEKEEKLKIQQELIEKSKIQIEPKKQNTGFFIDDNIENKLSTLFNEQEKKNKNQSDKQQSDSKSILNLFNKPKEIIKNPDSLFQDGNEEKLQIKQSIKVKTDPEGTILKDKFLVSKFLDKIQQLQLSFNQIEGKISQAFAKCQEFIHSSRIICEKIQTNLEQKVDAILRKFKGSLESTVYSIQVQNKMEEFDLLYKIDFNYLWNMSQLFNKNLDQMIESQLRPINVDYKLQFNASKEQILIDDKINKSIQYNNVIAELEKNVFAFQSQSQVDLIQIYKTDGDLYHLKHKATIKKNVEFVTLDGDRLICDDQVYLLPDTKEPIQELDFHKNITSSLQFQPGTIITGTNTSLQLVIWIWDINEQQYLHVSQKAVYPGSKDYGTYLLQNNQFQQNSILMKGGKNQIVQIDVIKNEIILSSKKLLAHKCQSIINYKLLNPDRIVVLGEQRIALINTQNQQKLKSVSRHQTLSKTLILPNIFNLFNMSIMFFENQNALQTADLGEHSDFCEFVEGLGNYRVLMQIPNYDIGVAMVVTQDIKGKLGVMEIYEN
ncbi:hypothetical protein OXYTRIMIC_683 [Oxytricha trifallax]|uniref:Uncharacterized protein n=1 Tax=Oxytricha trifallax TaxID=1172189 RepID=A0A073IBH3_9SPIT|nr:hypothetical protein OXYTRIMIC_683 [Oxytricha trifallax]